MKFYEERDTYMNTTCIICGKNFEARHSYGLCASCFSKDKCREYDRLMSASKQAERAGLAFEILLPHWLSIISDFKGLCAFCEEYTYSLIEMINPVKGLVYDNVVPACRACSKHYRRGFNTAEQRVKEFLASDRPIKTIEELEALETINI